MFKKIYGKVIHGEKLARKLGFPTANISYTGDDIEDSVYLINIVINSAIYSGMGSHMVKKGVFEAHIFDFDMNIYGKNIEIILLKKIRNNKKFHSLDNLISQISEDQIICKNIKMYVLTFGSFDLVHEGHKHYLFEAKKYGTHLSTIIASDKNIEKIKGFPPQNTIQKRVEAIKKLKISTQVIPGSSTHPMQWIESIHPTVICLGYDQRGPFVDALEDEIYKQGLTTKIIRIDAHEPHVFKSSLLKKKTS